MLCNCYQSSFLVMGWRAQWLLRPQTTGFSEPISPHDVWYCRDRPSWQTQHKTDYGFFFSWDLYMPSLCQHFGDLSIRRRDSPMGLRAQARESG